MVKEYGRHKVSSIQVLTFFLCVLLFFLLVFFFFRTLFNRSLPIQKYLSDGNFRNCLSTKRVFTEQVVRISL